MTALDGDLGWTLGVVFRAYVKACDTVLADVPGAHRGHQVLTAAARDEAPSQSALCEKLGIDRTVLTYLLDDMERADLVVRRPDPADRRTRRIEATDTGHALLARLAEQLRLTEERVLAGLPPEDRVTLKSLLTTLARHTNALDPVRDTCAVVEDITRRDVPPADRR